MSQPALSSVHELMVLGATPPISALSGKPEPSAPAPAAAARSGADAAGGPRGGDNAAGANAPGADAAAPGAPTRLDLATLYTSRGLFTGTPRMPVPSTLSGHLYVPSGAAGTAMANLAARMGMETTGIALPLATPIDAAAVRDVRTQAVLAGDSPLAQ